MQNPSSLLRSIITLSRNQIALWDPEQPVAVAYKVTSLSARGPPCCCSNKLHVSFQSREPGCGEPKGKAEQVCSPGKTPGKGRLGHEVLILSGRQQALPSRLPAGWVPLRNVHSALLPSLTAPQTLPRTPSFSPLPRWDGEPGGALSLPWAGFSQEGEGGAAPHSEMFDGTLSAPQKRLCLPQFSARFSNRNIPREGMVRFHGRALRSSSRRQHLLRPLYYTSA